MTLAEDVSWLKSWALAHDKRHVAEYERLTDALEAVDTHNHNHHGTRTRIKESSLTIIIFGAIAAFGQLVGLWELFASRLPLF